MLGWIFIGLGVLALATMKWWLPKLGASATTVAVAEKAAAFADEGAFLVALAPAYLIAVKRGDTKIKDLLNQCRLQSATWDDGIVATPANDPKPADVSLSIKAGETVQVTGAGQ